MLEIISQGDASAVQFGAKDLERRLRFGNVSTGDRAHIDAIRMQFSIISMNMSLPSSIIWRNMGKHKGCFAGADMKDEAKRLEREHLVAMVGGTYGHDYVEQRFRLGQLYNRAQLDVALFMGAFHTQMSSIGRRIMERFLKGSRQARGKTALAMCWSSKMIKR